MNPDLVVRDKVGKANTVRYGQVNAMLLNTLTSPACQTQKFARTGAALAVGCAFHLPQKAI